MTHTDSLRSKVITRNFEILFLCPVFVFLLGECLNILVQFCFLLCLPVNIIVEGLIEECLVLEKDAFLS